MRNHRTFDLVFDEAENQDSGWWSAKPEATMLAIAVRRTAGAGVLDISVETSWSGAEEPDPDEIVEVLSLDDLDSDALTPILDGVGGASTIFITAPFYRVVVTASAAAEASVFVMEI